MAVAWHLRAYHQPSTQSNESRRFLEVRTFRRYVFSGGTYFLEVRNLWLFNTRVTRSGHKVQILGQKVV